MSDPVPSYYPPAPSGGGPPPYFDQHEDLFDWAKIRRYAVFSLGSVRRRIGLFIAVAVGLVGLAVAALWALPKTYNVECKLLAQKNAVLAVRADANQYEQPTKSAGSLILQRDNLHALIRQSDAIAEWSKRRAPLLRVKDWLVEKVSPPPPPGERLDALTGLLEKNLSVWVDPEGAVMIQLTWPDPVMAYRLVEAAQQNFLEKRHVLEVETIAEQITILEGYAADVKRQVDKQVEELQRSRQKSAPRRAVRPPPIAPLKATDPEVTNLKVMLDAKRRAIVDLEEYRSRHLRELQTRLAEQRTTYSENHPIVVNLQESIESFRQDSPQLAALRAEEASIREQLARHGDVEGPPEATGAALALPADVFASAAGEDAQTEYARAQLRFSVQQYATMRERINAAKIDLDTARAAFKYRYSVVVPPEVPRGPVKPKKAVVIAAAVVAGLLLAIFSTTAADLRSGVIIEPWQIERLLGPTRAIVRVRLP
jgi:uncharacterized protein involved in exopolysaccharide biosynthesis